MNLSKLVPLHCIFIYCITVLPCKDSNRYSSWLSKQCTIETWIDQSHLAKWPVLDCWLVNLKFNIVHLGCQPEFVVQLFVWNFEKCIWEKGPLQTKCQSLGLQWPPLDGVAQSYQTFIFRNELMYMLAFPAGEWLFTPEEWEIAGVTTSPLQYVECQCMGVQVYSTAVG